MISRLQNADGKLGEAVWQLAIGAGDVKERLLAAFLCFNSLKESDFPAELAEDFRWIYRQLTRFEPIVRPNGEVFRGSVEVTLRKIPRATGVEIAKRICNLAWKVEEAIRIESGAS